MTAELAVRQYSGEELMHCDSICSTADWSVSVHVHTANIAIQPQTAQPKKRIIVLLKLP
jgi:hypothetical protein